LIRLTSNLYEEVLVVVFHVFWYLELGIVNNSVTVLFILTRI
jgi:hypothetical protein